MTKRRTARSRNGVETLRSVDVQARESNVGKRYWQKAPNTQHFIPAREVRDFIDWWTDPDRPVSEPVEKWCRENGVAMATVRNWWTDRRFVTLVEKRLDSINAGPERVQAVVNAAWVKAVGGDVRAMQLYLQYVDRLTAKVKIEVERKTDPKDVRSLSTEQLQAELTKIQEALQAQMQAAAIPASATVEVQEV